MNKLWIAASLGLALVLAGCATQPTPNVGDLPGFFSGIWNGFSAPFALIQGVPQDYKEDARLYGLAAAQGDASAQINLGVMYLNGQGVAQDYKEAVRLYGLAAAQGNADAQYNLGFMYDNGQGVAQDYVRAHMWYNLGAISGEKDNKAPANRDSIAAKMTPAQIAEAQAMARKCQASDFKQCD